MRSSSLGLVLRTAILAVILPSVAHAESGGSSLDGLRAKIEYCTDCHGEVGRGYVGWYPMPRIAGQTTEYFENQLRAFVTRNREKDIAILMYKVHAVTPGTRKALAAHFAGLNPRPYGGGPKELVERGRKIYDEGVPDANVPACSACHGPNAEGFESNPSLAGQLYPYLVKELTNWTKERAQEAPSETVAVMTPIAAALTKPQIKAVSAYLSSLWPTRRRLEVETVNNSSCPPCILPIPGDEVVLIGEKLATGNCTWCHGASAHGFATAPQLAGQKPQYLENQLRNFHDHRRDNPLSRLYMWGAAAKLDAATAHELAAYLAGVEPQAACDGDEQLAGAGKALYDEGIPDANIVPCIACHGPDAQGVGNIPRLGGQSYPYLKRRLVQWGEGFDASAAAPMPRIAGKLSVDQIEALSSYLSFVK